MTDPVEPTDDPTTEPPEGADQPGPDEGKPDTDDVFDAERAKAKIAKANQEAAGLRKRLKELEPLATKAKELEDAQKSESERLTERLTGAEARAKTAEFDLMRLRVGLEKGLTPKQAGRLVGSTKEELEADADDLLADFAPKKDDKPRVPTKPREKPRGGGDPDTDPTPTDPRKLAAAIPRSR